MTNLRTRSYTYRTRLLWDGERRGTLSSEGKQDIAVGTPPEFRGQPGLWSPEELLVASVESCVMLTFLALAFRADLKLASYESQAVGRLEFLDGTYAVTAVAVSPVITLANEADKEKAEGLFEKVHDQCFISNSIESDVTLEPVFKVGEKKA
ncbi:MAG: OsmC family protein [Chloroflexi bacterium]|nr:OsmC family protein [Chloroflexota bacterium]